MQLYSDTIPPARRSDPNELFFIRFEGVPKDWSPEAADTGGGMINFWVNADDLRSAENQAIDRLKAERWMPTRFDYWALVDRRVELEEEMRIAVEEAFEHGLSCVFYTWPPLVAPANVEAEFPPHHRQFLESVLLQKLAESIHDLPVELSIREREADVYGLFVSSGDQFYRFSNALPVLTKDMFEACETANSDMDQRIEEFARDVRNGRLVRRIDLCREDFERQIAEFLRSLKP